MKTPFDTPLIGKFAGMLDISNLKTKNHKKSKTITLTISRKKGVMGGAWCVDGTRIPVGLLITYDNLEDILRDYPHLKENLEGLNEFRKK